MSISTYISTYNNNKGGKEMSEITFKWLLTVAIGTGIVVAWTMDSVLNLIVNYYFCG